MQKILVPLGVVLAIAVVVLLNSFYIVRVDQQAILLQFGAQRDVVNAPKRTDAPDGATTYETLSLADNEAGLRFKYPFVQNVLYFDKKNMSLGISEIEVTALDQEKLIVDAFCRWRIVEPLQFYRNVNNIQTGEDRLQSILSSQLREALAKVVRPEIVSGQRAELMASIQEAVSNEAEAFGVEIVDVRIRRADLPIENTERVFERMRTERQQQAAEIRAEGEEEKLRIQAEADRTVQVTLATANEEGQKIRGQGDAQRNAVYASAYSSDPEFFSFYRSMIAYEKAIASGTPIIAPPDSEFFRYFGDQDGRPGR